MKRDFDLIRKILFDVESAPAREIIYDLKFDGIDEAVIVEHVDLLIEAGYLKGKVEPLHDSAGAIIIEGLTWAGHDLLGVMRDDTIWNKAKEHVLKPIGGVAIDVLQAWLKWQLSKLLGMPEGN